MEQLYFVFIDMQEVTPFAVAGATLLLTPFPLFLAFRENIFERFLVEQGVGHGNEKKIHFKMFEQQGHHFQVVDTRPESEDGPISLHFAKPLNSRFELP